MLLKFSNILAFRVASWHLEVSDVANLGREHVVAWTGRLQLFASRDIGPLAGAEAVAWGLRLQLLRVLRVLAWAWHPSIALRLQAALQLDAHREVGRRLLGKAFIGVVGAAAWNFQLLLVFQLDAHVEARLALEGRGDLVVASAWHHLRVLVVEHLPLVPAESLVRRRCLDEGSGWVVLDLSGHFPVADGGLRALGGAESELGGRLHGLLLEVILAGAGHELVVLLLELVVVEGRHRDGWAFRTGDVASVVGTRGWGGELARLGDLRTTLLAETVARSSPLCLVIGRVAPRSWHEFAHLGIGQVNSTAAAETVSRCALVFVAWAVLELVSAGTRTAFLNVLIDRVGFGVHGNFAAFSDARGDAVAARGRVLDHSLLHHAWTGLSADPPACSLKLGGFRLGVVLARRGLEALGLLKGKVLALSSANLESRHVRLDDAHTGRIIAGTGLLILLFTLRRIGGNGAHGEAWVLFASEGLCGVVSRARHFKLGLLWAVARGGAKAKLRS